MDGGHRVSSFGSRRTWSGDLLLRCFGGIFIRSGDIHTWWWMDVLFVPGDCVDSGEWYFFMEGVNGVDLSTASKKLKLSKLALFST